MTLEEIIAQLENIATLSTAELTALEEAIVALYQELRATEGDLSDEDVAALEELAAARTQVREQITANAEADQAQTDRLAALDAEMTDDADGDDADADAGDGDAADDEGGGDDAEGDDAGDGAGTGDEADDAEGGDDASDADDRELVTAGVSPASRRRLGALGQRTPRRQTEPPAPGLGTDVVLAAVDVSGIVSTGAPITSAEMFGQAMSARHEAVGPFTGGPDDPRQKFPVATVRRQFSADRMIRETDTPERITQVLDGAAADHAATIDAQVSAMGTDVVLAAGGPCVIAEADYNVEFVGSDVRPFTAAFPSVRFPRGRRQFYPPLCFDGSDAGTTFAQIGRAITQAQDEAGYGTGGGLTAPKGCVRIDCPTTVTCGLEILIECVTIGNWVDRSFAEYVRAWRSLVDVYYARAYEQRHIAQVVAGSAVLTDAGSPFGATLSLSSAVLRVIAHNNSARRTPNRQWHLILPAWAIPLLKIDLMRYLGATSTGLSGLNVTDAQVVSLLRNLGVNVSTYVDESGPTTQGDAQLLGLLTSGALPDLPLSVRAFLYPEGQWVRGTGGDLTVGIIRDSALVQANDFQSFEEEWTAMCQRGCVGDSFVLDAALCPNGVAGGTVVLDCFDESESA